nr:uncharacterized protein LOC111515505 [Leptinotarsa decemlineata]
MSGDAVKADIIRAVENATQSTNVVINISELRPYTNDTQTATLTMPKELANKLLSNEYIRVGLVRCRVEKRVRVPRCGKCWAHDHETNNCTGADRTKNCYKCGGSEHGVATCSNPEFCLVCGEQHTTGTLRCKAFKDALKRARNKEQRRTKLQREEGGGNPKQGITLQEIIDYNIEQGDKDPRLEQVDEEKEGNYVQEEDSVLLDLIS